MLRLKLVFGLRHVRCLSLDQVAQSVPALVTSSLPMAVPRGITWKRHDGEKRKQRRNMKWPWLDSICFVRLLYQTSSFSLIVRIIYKKYRNSNFGLFFKIINSRESWVFAPHFSKKKLSEWRKHRDANASIAKMHAHCSSSSIYLAVATHKKKTQLGLKDKHMDQVNFSLSCLRPGSIKELYRFWVEMLPGSIFCGHIRHTFKDSRRWNAFLVHS